MSFEALKKLITKRIQFEKENRFYPYNEHTLAFASSNEKVGGSNKILVALERERDSSLSYQVVDPKDPKRTVINASIKQSELYAQLGNRYDEFLAALKEKNLSKLNQFREDILNIASKKYFNPYREYPTDLNFCDIHGKSLLHYAAEQGLFEEIKRLIAEGANIDLKTVDWSEDAKSAIRFALEAGHLEIAEYLYQQGASCREVSVEKITHPACRKWLLNKIEKEIDDCCHVSRKDGLPCLEVNSTLSRKAQCFLHDEFSGDREILFRIVEIGALVYLVAYKNTYSLHPESDGAKALCLAAANGHFDIVEFLLDKASVSINPIKPYTTSALQAAISTNQLTMAKYLVSRGADIHLQDCDKYNALMVAVKCKNKAAVQWLLENKADIHQTDVHGNHILYLAVEAGDKEVLKLLLDSKEINYQLIKENIYGHSVFDVAAFKNRPEIMALLSSVNGKSWPVTTPLDIEIDHHSLIKKMFYYLRLRYFSVEFFPIRGKCNGFSYEHNHYQDRTDYLFDTLTLLKKWGGEEEDLYLPFPETIPQAKFYKNLDELFYQKINDILWFQHSTFNNILGKEDTFPKYDNYDRVKQYALIGNEKSDAPYLLCRYGGKLDISQIKEMLTYFKKMPTGSRLEITGSQHATSAYINEHHEIVYYDPRFPYRTKPLKEVDIWLKIIIDFKFINIGFYPLKQKKFDIKFAFFVVSKNLYRFNEDFHVFSHEEYSKPIVESFQSQSPNKFTLLHIAVLTRSLASVKKLLADGHCNVNAKDCNDNTALDFAISYDFQAALEILMPHPKIDVTQKNIHSLFKAYIDRLLEEDCGDFEAGTLNYLNCAIKENKTFLVKALIKMVKKEKLNIDSNSSEYYNLTPLGYAVQSGNEEIIRLLISEGSKWTTLRKSPFDEIYLSRNTPMKLVIVEYDQHYPLMITTLSNVNELDDSGNAAIHYAAQAGKILLVKDLIDRGANFQLKNKEGKTAYELACNLGHEKLVTLFNSYKETVCFAPLFSGSFENSPTQNSTLLPRNTFT